MHRIYQVFVSPTCFKSPTNHFLKLDTIVVDAAPCFFPANFVNSFLLLTNKASNCALIMEFVFLVMNASSSIGNGSALCSINSAAS
mmetsp:Transcript_17388/g.24795  ORF Transcript_17388/g.24795 Transcript_17388/m.24795 type:complete len:86 (-) Transcript_17388:2630-2887(-)